MFFFFPLLNRNRAGIITRILKIRLAATHSLTAPAANPAFPQIGNSVVLDSVLAMQ